MNTFELNTFERYYSAMHFEAKQKKEKNQFFRRILNEMNEMKWNIMKVK